MVGWGPKGLVLRYMVGQYLLLHSSACSGVVGAKSGTVVVRRFRGNVSSQKGETDFSAFFKVLTVQMATGQMSRWSVAGGLVRRLLERERDADADLTEPDLASFPEELGDRSGMR